MLPSRPVFDRWPQIALLPLMLVSAAGAAEPFRIEVVEKGSGWPVPLVELRTTGELRLVTDNDGVIAIDRPELFEREVFFHVHGHGYEVSKDRFGYRGVRLTPKPGESVRVEVERTMIAKRLGRLTGAGIFSHTQRLGGRGDWTESGVVGSDSVQMTAHRGKLFWLWGDTSLFHYPLGIFHCSAATTSASPLPDHRPPIGVAFDYFRNDSGRPRGVAEMPGPGPTWLTSLISVADQDGNSRLVATYAKIKPPLEAYQYGLCVWDETAERFRHQKTIWEKSDKSPVPPPLPSGHACPWEDDQGESHLLFGNPLPTLRCPAKYEALIDPSRWTTLEPQRRIRTSDGEVKPHSGSIAWNGWRKRWVTVFMQAFGKPSAFGEIWYAESESPFGPWDGAVKVLSHQNYTFYNPRVHPELSPADSPILLFEGTYTKQFADRPEPTPGHDYNQILYRIDLDDPRLRAAR